MTTEAVPSEQRRNRLALAAILAGVALAGCGGVPTSAAESEPAGGPGVPVSSSTTTAATTRVAEAGGPSAAGAAAVEVRQFRFMPGDLEVETGTTVTWTNRDDILHTATSGATPGTPDGRFDGPMDGPGQSFSHTFDRPGRYPYFCSRHTSMTGTVVVQ